MAAELVVHMKTRNPANYKYGEYRVYGDLEQSRYFRVAGQKPVEPLVRSLSVKATAHVLGRSFQGHAAVRLLTEHDDRLLRAWCTDLALEPRAHLVPETLLERAYAEADRAAVDRLLSDPAVGMAPARRAELRAAVVRNRQLVVELRTMYGGVCQLCGSDPGERYRHPICEAHHLQWLSRGGRDEKQNLILLCPNHHRAVHACDAHIDHSRRAMDFGSRLEEVRVDLHLWTA